MAKIPFSIDYRPQIESGEYKVETNFGSPVEIVCWNRRDDTANKTIVGIIRTGTVEEIASWNIGGKLCNATSPQNTAYDLFIVTPEPDRTEFEKAIWNAVTEAQLIPRDKDGIRNIHDIDEFIKKRSAELLAIAREQFKSDFNSMLESNYKTAYKEGYEDGKKEVLKDLPRWRRYSDSNNRGYGIHAGLLLNGDWLIELEDLEKLPKEDEK